MNLVTILDSIDTFWNMNFKQKLEIAIKKNSSLVCVGLDTELEKIPKHLKKKSDPIFEFNKAIIDATHDLVCVYKPNIAFYEGLGIDGLKSLKKTIDYIKDQYPHIPIVLDAKRADIDNTAKMYAKAIFKYWGADATTVYPNLGLDTVLPFLEYKDCLTILLVHTSNPGAKTFQNLKVNGKPYYLKMAQIIKNWHYPNIGIFIGATYPSQLKEVRNLFPDKIFLSAGFGAQKGAIKDAVKAGVNYNGSGIMFNASRSILYVSNGKNFAEKAREETKRLRDLINKYRYE